MDIPNTTAALILIAVVVVLFVFFSGCGKKKKQDHFTRTGLTSALGSSFVRSPVDYYSEPLENPHIRGKPTDKGVPLEYGMVDLYADERAMDKGTLWDPWKDTYVGDGNKRRDINNSSKTRHLMAALGNMTGYDYLNDVDEGDSILPQLDEHTAEVRADPDQRRNWGTGTFPQRSQAHLKAAVARGNCMAACDAEDEMCLRDCALRYPQYRE